MIYSYEKRGPFSASRCTFYSIIRPMPLVSVRHVSFIRHFKKYADRINTKYAAEICENMVGAYRIAQNQLPHLVQGSGHMDGAIMLATRWSR